jgi:hypothetical protein
MAKDKHFILCSVIVMQKNNIITLTTGVSGKPLYTDQDKVSK